MRRDKKEKDLQKSICFNSQAYWGNQHLSTLDEWCAVNSFAGMNTQLNRKINNHPRFYSFYVNIFQWTVCFHLFCLLFTLTLDWALCRFVVIRFHSICENAATNVTVNRFFFRFMLYSIVCFWFSFDYSWRPFESQWRSACFYFRFTQKWKQTQSVNSMIFVQ